MYFKLKKYMFSYLDLLLFLILMIIKSVFISKEISPYYLNFNNALKISSLCVLIIISISFVFKQKLRFYILYILNVFISLTFLIDLIYYRTNGDLLSLVSAKNGFLKDILHNSINVINPKDLLCLLDLILIPFIFRFIKEYNYNLNIKLRLPIGVFLLTICFILNLSYVNKLNKEQPGLLKNMSNKVYVARTITTLNYHALDFRNYLSNMKDCVKTPYNVDEIKNYIPSNSIKDENSKRILTGYGSKKNLIMIQFESLQSFVIDKKVNGKEITPNLNKLIKDSAYFNNCFYQVMDGNTSDAEFIVNNSIYPLSSGAVYYKFAGNTFNSLPKMLNNKGYDSMVFHGNNEGFWNRSVMYKAENFKEFFGYHSFNPIEEIGMGISDKEFYTQSLEEISKINKPFYSFLVTLTSHAPFKIDNYKEINYEEDEYMENYLNSIHYADAELGKFLDNINSKGLKDNSIIVVYGDHNGIPKNQINSIYKLENSNSKNEFNDFMYQKIPLIMHFPKNENKGVYKTYVGQMDIYPTIANLFNIDNKFMFGKDMFNSSNNKVIFRNGSFIKDNILYLSSSNIFYDIDSGNKVPVSNELNNIKDSLIKELDASEAILKKNLIKNK
ncbi:LTA synthase family protein [Clostridium rectalis]|uniref:LTA synthase family protein n=1 Tax=Clostridium rectalis TaxID=2040295 RepID=UPI000F63187E|nr:LTA synthase family protein [Clostridium rectalis]